MRRIANRDELLRFMEEEHQQHFKLASLLAVANGGAFGTCVTIWRDYASSPQYNGVGILFIILGAGLIASILNYGIVFVSRNIVRSSLMSHEDPNDAPGAIALQVAYYVTLVIAAAALIGAIAFVIWRSRSL
jgi:nitrate reductase NapE component